MRVLLLKAVLSDEHCARAVIQAEAARASISISFFNVFIMSSVLLVWKVKS